MVPILLEKVYQLIDEKVDPSAKPLVTELAKHLYRNISLDDLSLRNEADLYGAVMSLWQHLNSYQTGSISTQIFHPNLAQHGWQSSHTVIEIVTPDSPFLVDSVKMILSRLELNAHLMINGPTKIAYQDQPTGQGQKVVAVNGEQGQMHSIFHIEVDHIDEPRVINRLKKEVRNVLSSVALVVEDWQPMRAKLNEIIETIEKNHATIPLQADYLKTNIEFLRWLNDHNFTFMGYKDYDLKAVDGDYELFPTEQPALGLFKQNHRIHSRRLASLTTAAKAEARKPDLLILTKGNTTSKIHRPAYTDYIGIKKFDEQGNVVGEHRFTGLYTSAVYNQSVENIPLVRDKVARILEASGYLRGSYFWKALHNILENYPRDELLQAKDEELLEVGMGVVQMQDRDMVRLFVRPDPFGRFFSCMVYVAKDRFNSDLKLKTQRILKNYFGSDQEVEYTTYFSESSLARTHYIVRVDDNDQDVDIKELERNLMEASSSWDDRLTQAIKQNCGEAQAAKLIKSYKNAFPRSYKESTLPGATALADIEQLEKLDQDNKLGMLFYRPQEVDQSSKAVRLKLYHKDEPIHLSDVMPMLENLGLRVIGESPYEIQTTDDRVYWILDFSMLHQGQTQVDLKQAQERFQQAFAAIWAGDLESDGFNRLILSTNLSGREVTILRSYARYMRQVGFPFSQQYIEETLSNHAHLAQILVDLFIARFDPQASERVQKQQDLADQIIRELDNVTSLDDDRIIRRYMEMIQATIRTNFYQTDENGEAKPWLSLKLMPRKIPEIPAPVPEFEIFVYAPDVEGVHLRGGKVARGGLRWSDRYEDFRTEILGLVKAQQVKNTVIVPVGAKGGFVCRRQSQFSTRDEIFAEGQRCYQRFIRALLDVSDNIVNGEVVPPVNVVRHDQDDPYLVVAADKGTATFSDLANSVAQDYNFWLGDAFASGGSNGYDHKAMGITAKGGWESVKRHFREMDIDTQTTDFTCVGIGDMAGDVFGNGMLLSKHIRLQAAFNHMHIFIDPNPDSASSWQERERLFNLPRSSWQDYNADLISQGGGIFSRQAKSISLTPEIQTMLETDKDSMTPTELIHAILKMKVDLLWNGGIGTYVKARSESHADVGDRANDGLRVNGSELQAKVVGEGGNLGLTQLGRIEYAQSGGRVNTDFVDNVGGVDCSDNEVNIKIFLNTLVANGDLTIKQRNEVLDSMEDEISEIVLEDAYCQSESISVTESLGKSQVRELIRFIHHLEKTGKLDRQLENLPDDETLLEREKQRKGFTRPELSVLISYAKMVLKEDLLCDDVTEQAQNALLLTKYFPSRLREQYQAAMPSHPLRKEIIATSLANQMVNEMGCNFVTRLQEETGANAADITNAYVAAREIFRCEPLFERIRQLDNKISSDIQYQMLVLIRNTLRRSARWLIRNKTSKIDIDSLVTLYQGDVDQIRDNLDLYSVESDTQALKQLEKSMLDQGVDADLAKEVSRLNYLYSGLDVASVAKEIDVDTTQVAQVYFALNDDLSLNWFMELINRQPVENHWQALAQATFREDLNIQLRQLTALVLATQKDQSADLNSTLDKWLATNKAPLQRWNNILNEFKGSHLHEFAKFSVALRELALLHLNCAANQ